MVARLDPFQIIVNVSWASINRYLIVGFFDNASDSETGVMTPVLPTLPFQITGQLPDYNGGLVRLNPFPDGIDGAGTAPADRANLDAVNSVKKRKDLIDGSESYWYLTIQAWRGGLFNDIHVSQIGRIFFLGRYIIDHPKVNHFFFDASDMFVTINYTWDRPVSNATLTNTQDWGKPIPDLDGGPFDVIN